MCGETAALKCSMVTGVSGFGANLHSCYQTLLVSFLPTSSHPDIIVLGPLRRISQCFYLLPQTLDCCAPEGQVAVGSTRKGHWNSGRSPPGMCRMRHQEAGADAAPGTQEPSVIALCLFTRLTVILGGSGYVFSPACLWEYGGSGRCYLLNEVVLPIFVEVLSALSV